jgi:O-antigen/teichoic acid export membrane protein
MLSQTREIIVAGLLFVLGTSAVTLSILMLRRGKLYHRLSSNARPRRWVLISLLTLLAGFAIWFPVWMIWPHAPISRFLLTLFGVTFGVVCMAFKWFSGSIDRYIDTSIHRYIERKGWRLR